MRDRDDDAASRKHVDGVAGVARRGVKTESVLDAHIGRTELGQIAEDTVVFGHVCIFMTLARPCPRVKVSLRPEHPAGCRPDRKGRIARVLVRLNPRRPLHSPSTTRTTTASSATPDGAAALTTPQTSSPAFAIAWRRLDTVPEGGQALYWLYAPARRVLADHRRAQGLP